MVDCGILHLRYNGSLLLVWDGVRPKEMLHPLNRDPFRDEETSGAEVMYLRPHLQPVRPELCELGQTLDPPDSKEWPYTAPEKLAGVHSASRPECSHFKMCPWVAGQSKEILAVQQGPNRAAVRQANRLKPEVGSLSLLGDKPMSWLKDWKTLMWAVEVIAQSGSDQQLVKDWLPWGRLSQVKGQLYFKCDVGRQVEELMSYPSQYMKVQVLCSASIIKS